MKLKLTEAQVTKQHTDLLRAHGWTLLRLQSGLFQRPGSESRVMVGEKGMADWLCVRAKHNTHLQCFFLEIKATGKTPRREQLVWMQAMDDLGFLTTWSNDIDQFIKDAWHLL